MLKCLFALGVAQDVSSLEKYGSILLEFNRDGGELPSALNFCHKIAHVGKKGFEYFWLLILLDRRNNLCLQFLPAWRLTRAKSQVEGRRAWTAAHAVLVSRLVHHHVVVGRSSGFLCISRIFHYLDDLLQYLLALLIADLAFLALVNLRFPSELVGGLSPILFPS